MTFFCPHPGSRPAPCPASAGSAATTVRVPVSAQPVEDGFTRAAQAFTADITAAGSMGSNDPGLRGALTRILGEFVGCLRREVESGRLAWDGASDLIERTRLLAMALFRSGVPGIGPIEQIAPTRQTINQLVASSAIQLFGQAVDYTKLSEVQKSHVFAHLVARLGWSDAATSSVLIKLPPPGRAVVAATIALSAYPGAMQTRKLPPRPTVPDATAIAYVAGVPLQGSATAGLACSPGAQPCADLPRFVLGSLTAFM